MKPEHFGIFVTGLALEGIITTLEAESLSALQPSVEEHEAGALWTGKQSKSPGGHDLSTLAIFDIPKQSAHPSTTKRVDLYPYLRTLVEAAAYDQKFWKGYFFANARSKLESFYQASLAQQQQHMPIPPNLSDYTRPWTYSERRLLERGHLICTLLESFDNGSLTDFGIIRAVRASLVSMPGQGYWDAQELSTFLYHRVMHSGLDLGLIPQILVLRHDYDVAFQKVASRLHLIKDLDDQMALFKAEEEQRLSEIDDSVELFEEMKKKEMGRWLRFKKAWRKVLGKVEVVAPFDPFAEA